MPHTQTVHSYPPPPGQDILYENEIRLLQSLNSAEPLPDNAVVFTGSSIFRFWSTLMRDMAPLPVVNQSFGGARTWEVLHFTAAATTLNAAKTPAILPRAFRPSASWCSTSFPAAVFSLFPLILPRKNEHTGMPFKR